MTPTNRRNLLLIGAATIGGMGIGGSTQCSSGLDPAAIANAIKSTCGILVPAATVLEVINAAAGATAGMVVSLICSSYKNSLAGAGGARAATAVGEVNFTVHICDPTGTACKDVPVVAKTQ